MKRLKRHRVTFPYPEVPVLYAMCDGEDVAQLESKCAKLEAQNAELLEALEWIAKQYDDNVLKPIVQCTSDAYAMSAWARAAITKAKGEQP